LKSIATRLILGAICVSNSTHLPASWASKLIKPVIFAPGLGRLPTKPLPTGSDTITNTIGIVCVSLWSAAVTAVPFERMTWGREATNSFASVATGPTRYRSRPSSPRDPGLRFRRRTAPKHPLPSESNCRCRRDGPKRHRPSHRVASYCGQCRPCSWRSRSTGCWCSASDRAGLAIMKCRRAFTSTT
jgi:hypothetical protein